MMDRHFSGSRRMALTVGEALDIIKLDRKYYYSFYVSSPFYDTGVNDSMPTKLVPVNSDIWTLFSPFGTSYKGYSEITKMSVVARMKRGNCIFELTSAL